MKLPRRQFLHLAAVAAVLPAVSCIARAQSYPTRPMTMVVPYSAGGPTDTIARIMAERMRTSLGQVILVENTTGAAGTIGVGRVARAAPDGYTMSIGHWGTHVVNGAIYELPYHVLNDFEPVSLLATNPQLIVSKTRLGRCQRAQTARRPRPGNPAARGSEPADALCLPQGRD
jgi:tripartite-type tricarboxylate transporter receptor subunit TctC